MQAVLAAKQLDLSCQLGCGAGAIILEVAAIQHLFRRSTPTFAAPDEAARRRDERKPGGVHNRGRGRDIALDEAEEIRTRGEDVVLGVEAEGRGNDPLPGLAIGPVEEHVWGQARRRAPELQQPYLLRGGLGNVETLGRGPVPLEGHLRCDAPVRATPQDTGETGDGIVEEIGRDGRREQIPAPQIPQPVANIGEASSRLPPRRFCFAAICR